ncbi:MAG: protein NO VEIN domain-containing protein [Bryobacteraceae bacterium]
MAPERIPQRERLILAGLYLSKFDSLALRSLGFENFTEAFNVIGYALGSRPASIKNYRDEFDPVFPNRRKGWHKRDIRRYCLKVLNDYRDLDLESFTGLIEAFVGYDRNAESEIGGATPHEKTKPDFAKRLATGLAAERYFESVQSSIPDFRLHSMENTTRLGCGYDFKLRLGEEEDFLAVEVKGLMDRTKTISFTPKEHAVAEELEARFVLFVVKNFREEPYHEIFRNPVASALRFKKSERVVVQVSWLAIV